MLSSFRFIQVEFWPFVPLALRIHHSICVEARVYVGLAAQSLLP